MMRALARLLPLVLFTTLLAGCGNDMGELEQYIAEVKARKSVAIEPIPQIKQFDAFVYLPNDRRDPFVEVEPRNERLASDTLRPDMRRPREPLEDFPVDALRMLGMVTAQDHRYALIKAPDGVVHRVALGDHLGQNYGEVVRITESEVGLKEIVPDGFGGWVERPAKLALPD
jgi:type IV pilus assembly protein PilP